MTAAPLLTLGLPRMHKEEGERRDFLPAFVARMLPLLREVHVEKGIGTGLGLSEADYVKLDPAKVKVTDRHGAFQQDVVLVLRTPEVEEFEGLLRPKSILVSMLHFPTRPRRIRKLKEMGVDAISLDSLEGEDGRRLVENTRAVGWNGLEAAFSAIERFSPERLKPQQGASAQAEGRAASGRPGREPVRVTVMGAGQVGKHAVEAATKYGSRRRWKAWNAGGAPPVEVTVIGRDLTSDAAYMAKRLAETEVLVDASQRSDATHPLIPNDWIALLPKHAVVCDLVVDPYVPTGVPPTVRSIEGIPRGNLDQWIYAPDDAGWSATIPSHIPQEHRRATVTCYSWPGIHPAECMKHYGHQLTPIFERLLERRGVDGLSPKGDAMDRVLWRASVRNWTDDAKRVVVAG